MLLELIYVNEPRNKSHDNKYKSSNLVKTMSNRQFIAA